MPIKPHPTDPDKMVYVSRYYNIPELQGVTMTAEDEEFNRIERESRQRTEAVKYAINNAFKPFEPDWANFSEGRAAGRIEAFTEIADKIKAMPFGGDTIDSLIMWLEEQK
jgi:hypothetical protein